MISLHYKTRLINFSSKTLILKFHIFFNLKVQELLEILRISVISNVLQFQFFTPNQFYYPNKLFMQHQIPIGKPYKKSKLKAAIQGAMGISLTINYELPTVN